MGFLCFSKKKNENLFLFKKHQKTNLKKQKGWNFLKKKRVFLNPDYLSILFCDFPVMARSGTTDVTISLIGRARYT